LTRTPGKVAEAPGRSVVYPATMIGNDEDSLSTGNGWAGTPSAYLRDPAELTPEQRVRRRREKQPKV
ncbi:MAG: hypothetical protein K2J52_06850, partial [Duncaniella sp.]|nr:hypothetical protein [Duncaniella sp.]